MRVRARPRGEVAAAGPIDRVDSDLTAAERAFLSHLQVIADELRDTAHIIGAGYLTAHLPIADNGLLVFTVDYDDVTVTGPGFEWCLPGAP